MEIVTINQKGQITIPSRLRKELELTSGKEVRLFANPQKTGFTVAKTGSILDGLGQFPKPTKPLSIEEMDAAKESAAAEHALRHD